MSPEWVIGTGVAIGGVAVSCSIGFIGILKHFTSSISAGDEKLHNRINELNEKKLDKEDYWKSIDDLKDSITEIKEDQKEMKKSMDSFILNFKIKADR